MQDSGLLSEAQARVHPRANIVTRAIGVEEGLELAMVPLQIVPGDTYLLCSDGLNKTAEDHEIRDVLGHSDPYQVVRSLIHLGLTRGAPTTSRQSSSKPTEESIHGYLDTRF